ncbi:MAG: hypothetical protein U9Q82_03020 [Chloroflexota bacterium]|nr:hypothetical protein [Chloroflexota bacterium]
MFRQWTLTVLLLIITMTACEKSEPLPPTDVSDAAISIQELTAMTSTATVLSLPTKTMTVAPTDVPPTLTQDSVIAAEQPTPTSSSYDEAVAATIFTSDRFFEVQQGTPITMSNWAHPEAGCNWLGVAGQVFDIEGSPAASFIVEAAGRLEGNQIVGLALTGLDSVYGPAGYEIQLADHVIASQDEVWIQLKDYAGEPLSWPILIDTFDDCEKNVIVLNFVESESPPPPIEEYDLFLPLVFRAAP